MDFPERWAAELAGSKPAVVSGYSNGGTWKRPWEVQIKTESGTILTGSDNWMFRYLDVGDTTEWTGSRRIFVGGFFLRWAFYLIGGPIVFGSLVHDIIEKIRGNKNRK